MLTRDLFSVANLVLHCNGNGIQNSCCQIFIATGGVEVDPKPNF